MDTSTLIQTIRDAVIGEDLAISGPFGLRRVTYADYTASGRCLTFIEDFIREVVLPTYANTHTESSRTAMQTTRFREEARRIIHDAVGADEEYAVVFCGTGSTGAIDKMIQVLNLRVPNDLEDRYRLSASIPPDEIPVVFIGPFEHHSNELPWRESIAEVVVVPEDRDGHVDLTELEAELRRYRDRPLKIGSFSAASNVTGIVTDTRAVALLLHSYGALSFWDFAAAAPYVDIDVTPGDGAYMDAIFISPHKLIGGPGTPGVLVARRELFGNRVPAVPGGGTVSYVNPTEHSYLSDPEHREEGGTPDIIGSIRAGLIFQLKRTVGSETIRRLEESFIQRAIDAWREHPNIEILGNLEAERLSIVSFVVKHEDRYLHHNFVVALLNDLFGIQSRGGCSCAGPYGHRLLGIDIERSHEFESEIAKGCEGIKPGWTRVNFNYFISEEVFSFIIDAVRFVAEKGWRFLPLYDFEPITGIWRHAQESQARSTSLDEISYDSGRMTYEHVASSEPESRLRDYLLEAEALASEVMPRPGGPEPVLSTDFERLRWFPLPQEI